MKTKTRTIQSASIFLGVCLLSAFIGWLSGYDFNERNGNVAFWAVMTLFTAIPLSMIPFHPDL